MGVDFVGQVRIRYDVLRGCVFISFSHLLGRGDIYICIKLYGKYSWRFSLCLGCCGKMVIVCVTGAWFRCNRDWLKGAKFPYLSTHATRSDEAAVRTRLLLWPNQYVRIAGRFIPSRIKNKKKKVKKRLERVFGSASGRRFNEQIPHSLFHSRRRVQDHI